MSPKHGPVLQAPNALVLSATTPGESQAQAPEPCSLLTRCFFLLLLFQLMGSGRNNRKEAFCSALNSPRKLVEVMKFCSATAFLSSQLTLCTRNVKRQYIGRVGVRGGIHCMIVFKVATLQPTDLRPIGLHVDKSIPAQGDLPLQN